MTGGPYHNKVVDSPPSQDEINRFIMKFLTSTSKQREKQLLSSATGSFTYVTAHNALRSLGLIYGFKVSADDEGDPSIQAVAGLNGPHLRSPMKYTPVSPLSRSVLVPIRSEDVPEDSPFAFGTSFNKEDTTGKADWIKPFLDEVCHSLFSPYLFQFHRYLTISPLLVHSTPDQVTPFQSSASDPPSGEFQLVLLPIILPLLQGCVPPSSSNGDSARGMLEDLDSSCAFWYTAVTRASAAFMAEIKTGTRMKDLGDLLPKFNKRHSVLSDTPTPTLFSIDDDTQKQEVISVGASIQAKCNEFLTLNLSTTIQGQDDSKRDPIEQPIDSRIPRKVASAVPRTVPRDKPDIEDDITVDHSLLTSSAADTSLEARLAILFVSSTTSPSGVEILHAPDLSEDLSVRISFHVAKRYVPLHACSHTPRVTFCHHPQEITETRAVKERNNTFLSMWANGVEDLEEQGKDSNTIQQVVHGCNPPTLSTFQCAQFLAGVLRITPTTNLNDVSHKSHGFATLSLLPKPETTAYSSSAKSSEDAECEADTILGVAASQQARPDTTIESARSIPNAVAFNEFLCNWMFFILLNVKFKETGIILFDALWSIFLSCNTLAFRRRATKDLPVSPWLFFTLTQWVDRAILVLLSSCRKNKIIRKVKTGNFDVVRGSHFSQTFFWQLSHISFLLCHLTHLGDLSHLP